MFEVNQVIQNSRLGRIERNDRHYNIWLRRFIILKELLYHWYRG